MLFVRHRPAPPLDQVVDCFWWSARGQAAPLERMLPTGSASLVFSLSGRRLTCWGPQSPEQVTWSRGIVHGPHTTFYTSGAKQPGIAVGIAFQPGGAGAVLGYPAAALVDGHVKLEAIWERRALVLHERLCAAAGPSEAFSILERELTARIRRPLLMHPAVASSLVQVERPGTRVADLRHEFSSRHFIALFRDAVGMSPGQYIRLRRFSSVLKTLAGEGPRDLAGLAASAGYADQSHLNREFRRFAGISPTRYRPRGRHSPHHHALLDESDPRQKTSKTGCLPSARLCANSERLP